MPDKHHYLVPENHGDSRSLLDENVGYRRLAAAVIHQALRDLQKGPGVSDKGKEQIRWQTAFDFFQSNMYPYAQLLDLNPHFVREHLPQ